MKFDSWMSDSVVGELQRWFITKKKSFLLLNYRWNIEFQDHFMMSNLTILFIICVEWFFIREIKTEKKYVLSVRA